jgi:hypothetical protein
MQDLIDRIVAATGLTGRGRKSSGHHAVAGQDTGNQAKVGELFAKLPGAAELASRHGGDGAGARDCLGFWAEA